MKTAKEWADTWGRFAPLSKNDVGCLADLIERARVEAAEAMREAAAQLLQGLGNNEHHPESLARRIRAIDPESLMGGGT
jgi:hypothetical protein